MLLSIETSCDETAVSVICLESYLAASRDTEQYLKSDLIASKTKLHTAYGGVVPELAAREHIANLPSLVAEALAKASISLSEVRAIAVTRGPGLKGCLLVGLSFAKAISLSSSIPLLPIHHIEGHMCAGALLAQHERPQYPYLTLVVSGGHTMLVLVESFRQYKQLAVTRDDAAGEAFDKGATLFGLPYPGGPALSREAERGDAKRFSFPIAVPDDASSFSFSGLKTAVQREVQRLGEAAKEPQTVADLSASLEHAIVEALVLKSVQAAETQQVKSFLLTGGVAANGRLRKRLKEEMEQRGIQFSVPPHRWCTDNAAMIGVLAAGIIEQTPQAFQSWNRSSGEKLGPNAELTLGARAKWPIAELFENER